MSRRKSLLVIAMIALWAGCRTAPVAPPVPIPPPPPHPTIEKTFGAVTFPPGGGLSIAFKDLRLAIDPAPETLTAMASGLDFLLVTAAPPIWPSNIRRDLKIVCPSDAVAAARAAGLVNAKALGAGQRLMLSKSGVFAFVSAVPARNPATSSLVNGYLLEFDNGRNVFISGDLVDLAPVREFVYSLRDDGKQLQLAFVSAAHAAAPGAPLRSPDESMAAEVSALLGPAVAVIIDRGGVDRAKLQEAFTAQIFDGGWYVATPSETVPF